MDMVTLNTAEPGRRSRTFSEAESLCQFSFDRAVSESGPFWHVCTPGSMTGIINATEADYRFSVSNTAISAVESGVVILTDAQMSNHVHFLLGCAKDRCRQFLEAYRYRLKRYLSGMERFVDLNSFRCDEPIAIDNLDSARREIAYINRNGYVVDARYMPQTYPWGSGYLYFNLIAQSVRGISYNEIPFRERRKLSFRRVVSMPVNYTFLNGMILPSSYCKYALGESFFRDAHHYLSMVTRNVEAYSEEARRLGDTLVLTDEEMFQAAKTELAKTLHTEYRATNGQIRRIVKLPPEIIEEMFPVRR